MPIYMRKLIVTVVDEKYLGENDEEPPEYSIGVPIEVSANSRLRKLIAEGLLYENDFTQVDFNVRVEDIGPTEDFMEE